MAKAIDFVQLQRLMKVQLDADRTIRAVDVGGINLDSAIAEAAVMLNLPIRQIEYEVVERGSAGFLGAGKKEWKIKAYKKVLTKKLETFLQEEQESLEAASAPIIINKNGEVFVHFNDEGANIKVVAPIGTGKAITPKDAIEALKLKGALDINEKLVNETVKVAKGVYVCVGTYNRKYSNDSMVSVTINEDKMKAYISVLPPGIGGADISLETIVRVLKDNRVSFGIKEEFLTNFIDRPTYKIQVLAAEGQEAVRGRNAYMQYYFRTEQGLKSELREKSDGRVDFKESNAVQNVVKDQPLAKKIPAEEGVTGRDVFGTYLPKVDGQDIEIQLGSNVRLADDKLTILSEIAGQAVLIEGKVGVEPVYTINGNVNLKTGNIMFLGSVVITGDVEEGFSVKAKGNIEVKGTVENAELEAEGDIVVLKGISGKTTGTVKSGKSVYARFIENAIIEAGNMVIVAEGIVNSQVDAHKRIVCQGKRARIVGGRYRASEEINARVIGSAAGGTETVCEVGIDPKAKKVHDGLVEKRRDIEASLAEAQQDFNTLDKILKQRKSLPPEKEVQMQETMEKFNVLKAELKNVTEEIAKSEVELSTAKTRGRVSAADKIFPGVKITILDVLETIKVEYKAITFVLDSGVISPVKYEEPDEEAKRGPEGYM